MSRVKGALVAAAVLAAPSLARADDPAAKVGVKVLGFARIDHGKAACTLFDLFRSDAGGGKAYTEYNLYTGEGDHLARAFHSVETLPGKPGILEPLGGMHLDERGAAATGEVKLTDGTRVALTVDHAPPSQHLWWDGTAAYGLGRATLTDGSGRHEGQGTFGAGYLPTSPASFRFGHYRWILLADSAGGAHQFFKADRIPTMVYSRKAGQADQTFGQALTLETSDPAPDSTTKAELPRRWHVKTDSVDLELRRQAIVSWIGEDEKGKPVVYSLSLLAGKGTAFGKPVEVGGCAEYFED